MYYYFNTPIYCFEMTMKIVLKYEFFYSKYCKIDDIIKYKRVIQYLISNNSIKLYCLKYKKYVESKN